jgi:phytoene dehydrogenase-like protein
MGEILGEKGSWGFIEGGMGRVSEILKETALDRGVEVRCNSPVS